MVRDGVVFFTNLSDSRVYKAVNETCVPVSPGTCQFFMNFCILTVSSVRPEWVYGDLSIHPSQPFLVCVREDHTNPAPTAVLTSLVSLNVGTSTVYTISEGWGFYADPIVSPNGKRLAFTRWNHPDSAFHSLQLVVSDISIRSCRLTITHEIIVAGGPVRTVAQQPQWLSDDTLIFTFDVSGWGQPWMYTVGQTPTPVLLSPLQEDFSEPHWYHGLSSYALLDGDRAVCSSVKDGFSQLHFLDIKCGTLERLPNPYVNIRQVRRLNASSVVFVGSTTDQDETIVRLTFTSSSSDGQSAHFSVLAQSNDIDLSPAFIPHPQHLLLSDKQGRDLHVLYYPPTSPHYEGVDHEKPPAVIMFHSGPNSRPTAGFDWMRAFYTSRGWAW